jgi:hypothetical protein
MYVRVHRPKSRAHPNANLPGARRYNHSLRHVCRRHLGARWRHESGRQRFDAHTPRHLTRVWRALTHDTDCQTVKPPSVWDDVRLYRVGVRASVARRTLPVWVAVMPPPRYDCAMCVCVPSMRAGLGCAGAGTNQAHAAAGAEGATRCCNEVAVARRNRRVATRAREQDQRRDYLKRDRRRTSPDHHEHRHTGSNTHTQVKD